MQRAIMKAATKRQPCSFLCKKCVVAISVLIMVTASCSKNTAKDTSNDTGVEDLTIVVEADRTRILQEEQSLQQKRETFASEREHLQQQKEEIEQKLNTLSKKDKRQKAELEAQQKRLELEEKQARERASEFEAERRKLDTEKNRLLERIAKMTATKGGLTIEQREQLIAQREKNVAEREQAVAKREARVAARENAAAQRLDEINNTISQLHEIGSTVKNVMTEATNSKITRATADKAKRQCRIRMSKKGILLDDLPPAIKQQWQQANLAFDEKDYNSAYDAFNKIDHVVSSIRINSDFVKAKMSRINRDDTKISEAKQKQINSLLASVSEAMTDGRYDRANRKINQIVALLETP
ncbi:MAG: hypothetical protein JW841_17545 [Deltaproteobacteria bacterium]|nr:hypothetical protein [Deltaproteobacteria bacterium]